MANNRKAVAYVRNREVNKNASYETKFANFIQAISQAKATGCDVILIAQPWVIGDDYAEIIQSLSHLATAGISLQIATESNPSCSN